MASENEVLEQEDVKSRALLRLGVAGVVTAAALGALWWLDQDRKPETPKQAAPAPIVTAPPREIAPPMSEPIPDPASEPAAAAPAAAAPEAAAAAPAASIKPPPTQSAPPPPKVSSVPKAPSPAAAPPSRAEPPASPTPVVAGERYILQLGVFSDPGHAVELVNKLKKQGIRAQTETRVHLGPFAHRAEAEKARETVRKMGLSGIVTSATK